jgi:DNA-binding NtrC family response regulator
MIVDDDDGFRRSIEQVLRRQYHLVVCRSGQEALERITADVSVALLDIKMDEMDGLTTCRRLRQAYPDLPIIFFTGHPGEYESLDVQQQLHPFSYIIKGTPHCLEVLRDNLERAVAVSQRHRRAQVERERLRRERQGTTFEDIVGNSPAFRHALNLAMEVAQQECAVLIEGETGTGKELVAQAIHNASGRREGPFVALHCGGVADSLVEDELFGHERGAFTDAAEQRLGCFEQADGGSLLLDEIGASSPAFQTRLLRVLQDGRFTRVGGTRVLQANVRIIAATNQHLEQAMAEGSFRRDLYYRLNVFPISLPPLRERPEDVPLLARHFVAQFSRKMGRTVREIAPDALRALETYPWPGNVRELRNVIERAVILCHGESITKEHLCVRVPASSPEAEEFAVGLSLAEAEKRFILKTLRALSGNRTKTAETLGISRTALWDKLRSYGETDE